MCQAYKFKFGLGSVKIFTCLLSYIPAPYSKHIDKEKKDTGEFSQMSA